MGDSLASTSRNRASSVPSGLMAQTAAYVVSSPGAGLSRRPRSLCVNSTPGELATVVRPDAWRNSQDTRPVLVGVGAGQAAAARTGAAPTAMTATETVNAVA